MTLSARTHRNSIERLGLVLTFLGGALIWGETPAISKQQPASGAKERAHWAFQPLRRPRVPAMEPAKAARDGMAPAAELERRPVNPIDAFVLTRLGAKHLTPSSRATRRELIRRATYDLTGLPPTLDEVEVFEADADPQAWEKLIERLLSSPRYGEKWGRHWLDLVRFAESNSYERDGAKPHAWRYRDYVIQSFNADKPYDRFVREQLAGDELGAPSLREEADGLIATGYYRLGIWDDEPADRELARYDALDDLVMTTGQVFLGLTIDCARCHNHKIDPVPQRDYYRFLAFFNNITHYRNGGPTDESPIFSSPGEKAAYSNQAREIEAKRRAMELVVADAEAIYRRSIAAALGTNKLEGQEFEKRWEKEARAVVGDAVFDQHREARRLLPTLKAESIPVAKALVVSESGPAVPDTFVLARGNPGAPGEKVTPGFPAVLNPPEVSIPSTGRNSGKTTGLRSLLAAWIASDQNPMAARVMVNRIWQYHFGRGLVRSANNFGMQGDEPTHPELLDWLACEFMTSGWSVKAMHRLIMHSEAYQMSSKGREGPLKSDPANDSLWRFDMRRLTAEEVRDTILVVAGSLNLKMFGPGIYVDIAAEVLAGQSQPGNGWGKSPASEQARRSVYIHAKRSLVTPILEIFDMAETDRSTPVRFTTVQPTQALGALNGDFLTRQASLLASRLRSEVGDSPQRCVERALHLATARKPALDEIERGVQFLTGLRDNERLSTEEALTWFCLLVLNLNELMYLD